MKRICLKTPWYAMQYDLRHQISFVDMMKAMDLEIRQGVCPNQLVLWSQDMLEGAVSPTDYVLFNADQGFEGVLSAGVFEQTYVVHGTEQ